jgi:anti-sigma B factor antagonist
MMTMKSPDGAVGLEVRELGPGTTVVTVAGQIDVSTARTVRDAVDEALASQPGHLIIDLTPTDFLDSTGLGIIAGARARVSAWDGALTVVTASRRLRKHFVITGMDACVRMVPDLASVGTIPVDRVS